MKSFKLSRGGKIVRFHAYFAWILALGVLIVGFPEFVEYNNHIREIDDKAKELAKVQKETESSQNFEGDGSWNLDFMQPFDRSVYVGIRNNYLLKWFGLVAGVSTAGALLYAQSERHLVAPQPIEPNR
ncbi:MAG: hypothetical protein KDC26_00880 [Armatimonadetes bacterium]|nr:hypothetical protein [Armatimonadota bacterium]